eukprot:COSAG04_NODE_32169_length_252_cov_1.169935_1_plen_43_part_01
MSAGSSLYPLWTSGDCAPPGQFAHAGHSWHDEPNTAGNMPWES